MKLNPKKHTACFVDTHFTILMILRKHKNMQKNSKIGNK